MLQYIIYVKGKKVFIFLHSSVRTENLVNVKVTKNILFLFELYFLESK